MDVESRDEVLFLIKRHHFRNHCLRIMALPDDVGMIGIVVAGLIFVIKESSPWCVEAGRESPEVGEVQFV